MKFYDSSAHRKTRVQFLGMEWFCKVVVGSGRQTSYNVLLIGMARNDNDVGVGIFELGTNVLAKLDPAEVRHHPIGNQQVRLILREKIHGLLTSLGEQDAIPLFR